jgi:hypothetical protein
MRYKPLTPFGNFIFDRKKHSNDKSFWSFFVIANNFYRTVLKLFYIS